MILKTVLQPVVVQTTGVGLTALLLGIQGAWLILLLAGLLSGFILVILEFISRNRDRREDSHSHKLAASIRKRFGNENTFVTKGIFVKKPTPVLSTVIREAEEIAEIAYRKLN